MNSYKTILLAVVLLATTVPLARAQGTYKPFDVPGAVTTEAFGINTAGDIVGFYVDTNFIFHGFLFSGGTYTTIDYTDGTTAYLFGINDLSQIVGNAGIGFLYDVQTQTFTTISYPHANGTLPDSINNSGMIAGTVNYRFGEHLGFESDGSKYRQIAPPGTTVIGTVIADSGEIVGTIANESGGAQFLFKQGKYARLTIPNASYAYVYGINPAGTAVVGYYTPSPGITAGFLYQNKTLTTLQFPGSTYTIAGGINAAGEVVGYFVDTNNIYHGFTWTPASDAQKK